MEIDKKEDEQAVYNSESKDESKPLSEVAESYSSYTEETKIEEVSDKTESKTEYESEESRVSNQFAESIEKSTEAVEAVATAGASEAVEAVSNVADAKEVETEKFDSLADFGQAMQDARAESNSNSFEITDEMRASQAESHQAAQDGLERFENPEENQIKDISSEIKQETFQDAVNDFAESNFKTEDAKDDYKEFMTSEHSEKIDSASSVDDLVNKVEESINNSKEEFLDSKQNEQESLSEMKNEGGLSQDESKEVDTQFNKNEAILNSESQEQKQEAEQTKEAAVSV